MITGSEEYQALLKDIQDGYNPPDVRIRIPQDEPVYTVDWNTRKIAAPKFLSVEADHSAEIIFFEMDRFYDGMDLANMIGIIQFRNAKNEEYFYVIPYYDTTSHDQKLIVPWNIQSQVTKYGGTINFSFKFFKVNTDTKDILYEINTLVASSKVLIGWANIHGSDHKYNTIDATKYTVDGTFDGVIEMLNAYRSYEDAGLKWIDV